MTTPFLLAVAAALPLQGAEEGPAAGVTLKENRDLADRIQDVTTLLGAKRTEPAIALLNQVLEFADNSLVILFLQLWVDDIKRLIMFHFLFDIFHNTSKNYYMIFSYIYYNNNFLYYF